MNAEFVILGIILILFVVIIPQINEPAAQYTAQHELFPLFGIFGVIFLAWGLLSRGEKKVPAPTTWEAPPPPPPRLACPRCGASNLAGSKYCAQCGSALQVTGRCPSCGASVEVGAKFCPQCGAKLA